MLRNDVNYEGVTEYTPRPLKTTERIVAIWFDGEPDMYICDGQAGLDNLVAMYKADWEAPPDCTFIGHVAYIHVLSEGRLIKTFETDNYDMEGK